MKFKKKIINCTLLIPLLVLSLNCNKQSDIYSSRLLENRPYIIFCQSSETANNNYSETGKLILLNLKGEQKILLNRIPTYSMPKFLNKEKDLIMFDDYTPHMGRFLIVYLSQSKYKRISIQPKLNSQNEFDQIYQYDIYNDNSIIFGFNDKIYSYNVNKDSLEILKEINNKLISDISFDSVYNRVFFSYQEGLKDLGQKYFGIYELRYDSLLFTGINIKKLGNLSPDRKKIILNSFYNNTLFYDIDEQNVTTFNFVENTTKEMLDDALFINDSTLLLQSFNLSAPQNTDLYLLNIKTKKTVNRLTSDHYNKTCITVYF